MNMDRARRITFVLLRAVAGLLFLQADAWITRYGGTVDLAIEDPQADHGGFHRRPDNCDKALDVFDALRARP